MNKSEYDKMVVHAKLLLLLVNFSDNGMQENVEIDLLIKIYDKVKYYRKSYEKDSSDEVTHWNMEKLRKGG